MEEKKKPRHRTIWLMVGLVLLVGYPLSSGPVYGLVFIDYLPYSALKLYQPLETLIVLTPEPLQFRLHWHWIKWLIVFQEPEKGHGREYLLPDLWHN